MHNKKVMILWTANFICNSILIAQVWCNQPVIKIELNQLIFSESAIFSNSAQKGSERDANRLSNDELGGEFNWIGPLSLPRCPRLFWNESDTTLLFLVIAGPAWNQTNRKNLFFFYTKCLLLCRREHSQIISVTLSFLPILLRVCKCDKPF